MDNPNFKYELSKDAAINLAEALEQINSQLKTFSIELAAAFASSNVNSIVTQVQESSTQLVEAVQLNLPSTTILAQCLTDAFKEMESLCINPMAHAAQVSLNAALKQSLIKMDVTPIPSMDDIDLEPVVSDISVEQTHHITAESVINFIAVLVAFIQIIAPYLPNSHQQIIEDGIKQLVATNKAILDESKRQTVLLEEIRDSLDDSSE